MRLFASLCAELCVSVGSQASLASLQRYFAQAGPADAAWALFLLLGGKTRRSLSAAQLRAEACAAADIPDWLFELSLQATGDLAETIAHVLPPPRSTSALGLSVWLTERLLPLCGLEPDPLRQPLRCWWDELVPDERWLLVKLIGGDLRLGVSKSLVQRALARHGGLDPRRIAQGLLGWTDARNPPSAERFLALLAAPADSPARAPGQPYPFCLGAPLQAAPDAHALEVLLGPVEAWQAEWCCVGLRVQILRESDQVWIWSPDEELITDRFPDVVALVRDLPEGSALDGELLVWIAGAPASFYRLQQRLGRKALSRQTLAELPVQFMAQDLLALAGEDLRALPQHQRREQLEALSHGAPWQLSQRVQALSWAALIAERQRSGAQGGHGLMLKHRDAVYGSGLSQAGCWIWPSELLRVVGVLVYAQVGGLAPAELSLAVWNRKPVSAAEAQAVVAAIEAREPPLPGALQLVVFAKTGSGLSGAASEAVEQVVRAHTLQKFGPVRSLRPTLLFELGFEAIARSPRHKSGVALRAPQLLRICDDKLLHEAHCLDQLLGLLAESVAADAVDGTQGLDALSPAHSS